VKSHAQKFALRHPCRKRNLEVEHLHSKLRFKLDPFQARNDECTSVIGSSSNSPVANETRHEKLPGVEKPYKKETNDETTQVEEPQAPADEPLPVRRQTYLRRVSNDSTGRQGISIKSDPDVIVPKKFDVICALGEAYSVHHSGNRRFQVIIEMNMSQFVAADTNTRRLLVEAVLKTIKQSGGRFIQRRFSGDWKVGSDAFALRKIEASFVSFLDAHTCS
jgi:hypothetical protein